MSASPERIAAAQAALARLGVTLADLQRDQRPPVPSVAEYLTRVVEAASPGTRRVYSSYWQRMATTWGDRSLDTVTATDVGAMQRQAAGTARPRRNGRRGRHGPHRVPEGQHFPPRQPSRSTIRSRR